MHSFLLTKPTHRKMIQSSALRLRLWLCHFKISSDTPALRLWQEKQLIIKQSNNESMKILLKQRCRKMKLCLPKLFQPTVQSLTISIIWLDKHISYFHNELTTDLKRTTTLKHGFVIKSQCLWVTVWQTSFVFQQTHTYNSCHEF